MGEGMVDIKKAYELFSKKDCDLDEACGVGLSLCQELETPRRMVEELLDMPYEEALAYKRRQDEMREKGGGE